MEAFVFQGGDFFRLYYPMITTFKEITPFKQIFEK